MVISTRLDIVANARSDTVFIDKSMSDSPRVGIVLPDTSAAVLGPMCRYNAAVVDSG